MLAGLLQDLGVLCLAQAESERYLPLLREAGDNTDLVARERSELGCSHADVGAWVAEQWGLPRYLVAKAGCGRAPGQLSAQEACRVVQFH